MSRKTTRLYYGLHPESGKALYWTLKVKNATKPVKLRGNLDCAKKSQPGLSFGCFLHHVADHDKAAFPHPALFISFTKTVALIVTEIAKGRPTKCVRYRHAYGRWVDLNDRNLTKQAVKQHPEIFERPFTLSAYHDQDGHWKPEYGRPYTGERRKFQMRSGELARLKKAGLINLPL